MRSHSFVALISALLTVPAACDRHYFYSGFFSGTTMVGVEYDDVAESLTLTNNITTNATGGSKWIALDEAKKNLYVTTTGFFQSYAITSNGSLSYSSQATTSSNCTNPNFITVSKQSPYTVFGTPYSSGCATLAISVDSNGALSSQIATLPYNSAAGVHGTALSPDGKFLYSADDMGNAVWVHATNGTELQYLPAPSGSNPRHLAVHPNGNYVYVIFEKSNELATYARNPSTGLLTDTNVTYPLIPSGFNSSDYWSDEVMFSIPTKSSSSPKYLITGTRAYNTTSKGYISAFSLDSETGAITEQLFLVESTASGGAANAVSPAPFDEQLFAITDSGANFVEMWRIGEEGRNASVVAHLGLASGPANVVWVN